MVTGREEYTAMNQYKVIRTYDLLIEVTQDQIVTAASSEKAINVAKELNDWGDIEMVRDLEDYLPAYEVIYSVEDY